MRRVNLSILVAASLLLFAASAADAGPIRNRQHRQAVRIGEGANGGTLTRPESKVLRHEQRAINRGRDRALSDGRVGPREARRLTRAQNQAGRHIYRLKHNRRSVEQ